MKDSAPDRRPKPQPAMSGGPPKPPKQTARGLEGESPDDPMSDDEVARHVIKVFSKILADPNTSTVDRTRCKLVIKKLYEDIRKRGGKS